MQSHRLS